MLLIFLLIPIAILAIAVIYFVSIYNNLVSFKNAAVAAWHQIDVQLTRRADLVGNLVETVKGYASHEKTVFEDVATARSSVMQSRGARQAGEASASLDSALSRLFAVAESYPDLKASANFMSLQAQLTELENTIAAARQFYNDNVRRYNVAVQQFPATLFASSFRIYIHGLFRSCAGRHRTTESKLFIEVAFPGQKLETPEASTKLSIVANFLLLVLKFIGGFIGGSKALIADFINSLLDLIANFAVLIGIRVAQRPADAEHQYGHGNADVIAAFLVAVIILMTGVYIGYDSANTVFEKKYHTPNLFATAVALFTIFAKTILYRYTKRVGLKSKSAAVLANAQDHKSDVYASVRGAIGNYYRSTGISYLGSNWRHLGIIFYHTKFSQPHQRQYSYAHERSAGQENHRASSTGGRSDIGS